VGRFCSYHTKVSEYMKIVSIPIEDHVNAALVVPLRHLKIALTDFMEKGEVKALAKLSVKANNNRSKEEED